MMSSQTAEQVHPAFRKIRSHHIETLQVTLQEYEHRKTGARHLHMASVNDENVFLVALRTLPMDSTGVAHILEHTALCGSERFPVRDPFFMMIRRSLNSFMNAFTSSDWTAYPFASKNSKDFQNLLTVYLDAVFFSRLDPLDFAQEGHRLEFATPDDASSPLVYKGVVYNEMKGAMSSPTAQLWQQLTGYLFPSTTYHFNSGGEPEHITDLTYDQLLAFYRKHYHPSNAIFATFGNQSVPDLHEQFESLALSRFSHLDIRLPVKDEKRYFAPLRIQQAYGIGETESTEEKTHLVMGWLLGHSFNLESNLEAHLLSSVLLDNSASPLMRALETSDLGKAPSPLCGLEDSNREMTFVCGIEGSEAARLSDLEALVEGVLNEVVQTGVPQERLEAILHQLELHQREISGDQYPYGLQLILSALSPLVHGGDPVALLDLDPVLVSLREKIKDPAYVPGLLRRLLLENPHRVTLALVPDTHLEANRDNAIEQALAAKKAALSEAEIQQIIDRAAQLKARQMRKDDDAILPKVGVEDVPASLPELTPVAGMPEKTTAYAQGTNGLVYQQLVMPLPALDPDEQALLPIYTSLFGEVGCGPLDYLGMQDRISAETGGVGCYAAVKSAIQDAQLATGYLILSGKALSRYADKLNQLLFDLLGSTRFDEAERIRELIAQMRARREQSVTGNGHALAMGAAAQGLSPIADWSFRLHGLHAIRSIKVLDDSLSSPEALQTLLQRLQQLHRKMVSQPVQHLLVAEQSQLNGMREQIQQLWRAANPTASSHLLLPPVSRQVNQAWMTTTQVNFCARAYPTVAVDHADAPALTVLGGFLRNGYLHRAIREQGGAYGGGAGQDSNSGVFRFYSYRDPRLTETLADFDASLDWLASTQHEATALEEAILGVIGQLDKPRSPAGEAKHVFHGNLFGRDAAQRQRFRAGVLKVTLDDLQRVANRWLRPDKASTALVTSAAHQQQLTGLGFETLVL